MGALNLSRRAALGIVGGVAALSLAGLPSSAGAEGLMEAGKGDGLRVAYYNFAPFAYVNADGDVVGEQVEILRYVLGEMGLKVASEVSTEWGALIPGLKAGRFDVVAAAMFVTPKRCAAVAFSEPTFGIKQGLVVPKGNPNGISDYESVHDKGLRIAAISGTAQVDWARSVGISDDKIIQIPDNPTGIAAVRAGRADLFAIDAPGARQLIGSLPEGDMEMLPPFGEIAGKPASPHGAYAFRTEDADFVEAFNKELTGFIGTDGHVAIMEAHGLEPDELPKMTTLELCSG